MRDPLNELKGLTGQVSASPLPPEQVRRRGDRMRRRRTLVQAVGAAAAVAVVVSGGAFVTGTLSTAPVPPGPATQSPTPSSTPSPAPTPPRGWVTTIPDDLGRALHESLPDPVEGERARTVTRTDLPWQSLPCGEVDETSTQPMLRSTWFPELDDRRTDQQLDLITPPAAAHARQLVVYPDAETAASVVEAVREQTETCGPLEAVAGITEFRWSAERLDVGGDDGLLLAGGELTIGSDERGVGRSLLAVVREGNAVLVVQLADESSAPLDDLAEPDAARLVDVATSLAGQMCVFATEPCRDATTPEERSPSATPGAPTLTEEHLLTADEIPFTSRFSFVDSGSTEGGVSRCAQGSWDELGASSVLRRYFVVPGRPIETRTGVAEFPDEAAAQAAYNRIQAWIDSCPATLRDQGFDRASILDDRWTPDYRTAGARGVFAELDYGPAPKEVDPRGEMGYFQSDGVVLVGNRLSWLSLSAIDVEWHFSRDPEFTDLPMHPFFTAMPRAAERLARG